MLGVAFGRAMEGGGCRESANMTWMRQKGSTSFLSMPTHRSGLVNGSSLLLYSRPYLIENSIKPQPHHTEVRSRQFPGRRLGRASQEKSSLCSNTWTRLASSPKQRVPDQEAGSRGLVVSSVKNAPFGTQ